MFIAFMFILSKYNKKHINLHINLQVQPIPEVIYHDVFYNGNKMVYNDAIYVP